MSLLRTTAVLAALAALARTAPAQVPVDLGTWTAESYDAVSGFGAGVWTVAGDGASVTQSVNGQPTLFYSPFDVFNTQAQGRITAQAGDDDYIGFAIGFEPGDTTSPDADYLLVDWKLGTQAFNFGAPSCTGGSTAPKGLAVSRVRGTPTADEFWGHVDLDASPCSGPTDSVTELARGATLGDVGWVPGQTYDFRFEFSATTLRVFVDGLLELEVFGLFDDGRIAFCNFSQANVTYDAYTVNCAASWAPIGFGHPGTVGTPDLALTGLPVLGTSTAFELTSSDTLPSTAIVAFGLAPAVTPTPFGGTLFVAPTSIHLVPLPPGSSQVPLVVPFDVSLCASAWYLQFAQLDPGASHGLAFSPGLEVLFGF